MTTPDWQPHDAALIEAWGDTIANSATGAGYNFLENRTTRLRERIETFFASPSEERFADIWTHRIENFDSFLKQRSELVRDELQSVLGPVEY